MLLFNSVELQVFPNTLINACSSLSVSFFQNEKTWKRVLLDLKCPPVEAVGNYNGTAAASVPERFFIIMQLVGRVINIQIRVGDFFTNGTDFSGSGS